MLLDAGDDPSPGLTEAIRGHRTDIVRILLASGATDNPNARNGDALKTAFQQSCCLEMIKLLLDYRANPLACSGECMRWACRYGRLSAYKYMSYKTIISGNGLFAGSQVTWRYCRYSLTLEMIPLQASKIPFLANVPRLSASFSLTARQTI